MTKNTAASFWSDLGKHILLIQGIGLAVALILFIYGATGHFPLTLKISLIYSNLNGFSAMFFFHLFRIDWFETRYWGITFIIKSITVMFLSVLVATEIGTLMVSMFLRRDFIPFVSLWHLYLTLMNLVISASTVLLLAFYKRLKYRLERREREYEELRNLQLRTQLAVLKAKLNPHFLFNSLNAILDLVYKAPQQVETMVHNLAHIYRRSPDFAPPAHDCAAVLPGPAGSGSPGRAWARTLPRPARRTVHRRGESMPPHFSRL